MKILLPLLVLLAAGPRSGAAVPAAEFDHEHALLTAVLREHVRGDRLDYHALKADRSALDRYLRGLEAVTAEAQAEWTRAQRYAFWIDAYNAYTLARVLDGYPVASIKDLGTEERSVWDEPFIPLGALHPKPTRDELTLNRIEHEILRPVFGDPRVHAAVNCAAVGCPPLRAEAFVAARLDRQLDEQVRAWLADPARNRYDRQERTLHLSKVFEWFVEDWKDHGGVADWVARYAPSEHAAWIRADDDVRIRYVDYSWKLNDVE